MREEFQDICHEQREHVLRIMITSGGTDIYNVIGNLLDALSHQEWFSEIQYDVIVGKFNQNREILEERWKKNENIHFFCNVSNMSDYMKQCDIAVTAAGSTVYELCACGVPFIMYTLADNQWGIACSFSERGLSPWTGDVRKDMKSCIDNILSEIEHLRNEKEKRMKKSQDMMCLVDGKGCARIAELILFYIK